MTDINWDLPYQVIHIFYFQDTLAAYVTSHYWQLDEGIYWRAKLDVEAYLASCKRFRSENYGLWYVEAPESVPDSAISYMIKAIVTGKTKRMKIGD